MLLVLLTRVQTFVPFLFSSFPCFWFTFLLLFYFHFYFFIFFAFCLLLSLAFVLIICFLLPLSLKWTFCIYNPQMKHHYKFKLLLKFFFSFHILVILFFVEQTKTPHFFLKTPLSFFLTRPARFVPHPPSLFFFFICFLFFKINPFSVAFVFSFPQLSHRKILFYFILFISFLILFSLLFSIYEYIQVSKIKFCIYFLVL